MSRCNGLHASGMLHSQLVTDILGQHIDPVFKGQEVREDWTFWCQPQLPTYTRVELPRRAKTLITPWQEPKILQGEMYLEPGPVVQGRQTRWPPCVVG